MATADTFNGRVRAARIARRGELRRRGIVPCRELRVYRVDLDVISVPEWAVRRSQAEGFGLLSRSESHVWLRRRTAKLLCRDDREAGGDPKLTAVEYRRCPQCGWLLLGEDAAHRRRLNESCRTGTMLPCDGDCLERQRRKSGSGGSGGSAGSVRSRSFAFGEG